MVIYLFYVVVARLAYVYFCYRRRAGGDRFLFFCDRWCPARRRFVARNRHELFESVSEKENGFKFFELKLVKKVIMRNLLRNV